MAKYITCLRPPLSLSLSLSLLHSTPTFTFNTQKARNSKLNTFLLSHPHKFYYKKGIKSHLTCHLQVSLPHSREIHSHQFDRLSVTIDRSTPKDGRGCRTSKTQHRQCLCTDLGDKDCSAVTTTTITTSITNTI